MHTAVSRYNPQPALEMAIQGHSRNRERARGVKMQSARRAQRWSSLWLLLVAVGTAFVFAVPQAAAATTTPAPVVTSVSPSTGFISEPQAPEPLPSVTISGANFDGATEVWFGQYDTINFKVVSSSEIVATTGIETLGNVDVTVTTPAGTSATSPADQFTFTTPPVPTTPPVVTSVTPSTVSSGGTVTVNGSNFLYETSVQVGSTSIPSMPSSSTQLFVDVPPEPVGTVLDLTVTGPAGTSVISSADRITYEAAPPPPRLPGTGRWPQTVASSPSVTLASTGRWVARISMRRLSAWRSTQ